MTWEVRQSGEDRWLLLADAPTESRSGELPPPAPDLERQRRIGTVDQPQSPPVSGSAALSEAVSTKKITVTVPDWLHPYITEAAERRNLSVSERLSRAAQVELYREEGEAHPPGPGSDFSHWQGGNIRAVLTRR